MTVGDRIKQLRVEKGFTQQQLAESAGVSKQAIFKYENNIVTNIPSDKVRAIARLLGVEPAFLMGWEIPKEKEKTVPNEEDSLNAEIVKLFTALSADRKKEALTYLRYLYSQAKEENPEA